MPTLPPPGTHPAPRTAPAQTSPTRAELSAMFCALPWRPIVTPTRLSTASLPPGLPQERGNGTLEAQTLPLYTQTLGCVWSGAQIADTGEGKPYNEAERGRPLGSGEGKGRRC